MNLEAVRRTPGYAESQIRLLISDLKNQVHGNKIKSVKAFLAYVETYKPDIYDDDIDYLYTGEMDGILGMGLLAWCGADSEKHGSQLKRIAAPCIELLHSLVTLDLGAENLFYERFVVLPMSELLKINFVKHVSQDGGSSSLFGNSRTGDGQEAMKLLALLMQDHRTADGHPMPIDIAAFFGDNKLCRERFTQYLQRSTTESISNAITKLKGARSDPAHRENRPKLWSEVRFRPLPLQEGEADFVDRSAENEEPPPVRDPLGLSPLDLRATQQLLASGGRAVSGGLRAIQMLQVQGKDDRTAAAEDAAEEEEEEAGEKKLSVLPTDREFSAIHFLATVHPAASFEQLRSGLGGLCGLLLQQSGERDNLVRVHLGLFVHCIEGLDWIKAFRKGAQRRVEAAAVTDFRRQEKKSPAKKAHARQLYKDSGLAAGGGVVIEAPASSQAGKDGGEERLLRAIGSLSLVQREVQRTLTPIVTCMAKNRKIRKTEKVLRRLAATLEYPNKMRSALEAGDFDEVISVYQRVRALPGGSAARILQRVISAADEVAARVRALVAAQLALPQSDYTLLLRAAGVVRSMDGRAAYIACLHNSFRAHQRHFVAEMNKLYAAFCQSAAAAHARALEQETARKLRGDFGSERLAAILKSSSSGGDLAALAVAGAADRARGGPRRVLRRGQADAWRDDDLASERSGDDDELEVELDELLLDDSLEHAAAGSAVDMAADAASEARLAYVQAVVDLVEQWLPSLHALAATVALDADQATGVGAAAMALLAAKDAAANGQGVLDKEYLKPSRDLGVLLLKVGEIVKQAIAGYAAAPVTMRAAAAGSKGWKALKTNLSLKAVAPKEGAAAAPGAAVEGDKMGEKMQNVVFSSAAFQSELPEPYLRGAIGEVSDLFETIEAVLLSVVVTKVSDSAQRNLNASVGSPQQKTDAAAAPTHNYDDALAAFEAVARDGDVSTAAALCAKLQHYVLGKQASFGRRGLVGTAKADFFVDASAVVQAIRSSGTSICIGSSLRAAHSEGLAYKPLHCERRSRQLEQLLLRALPRIKERVLRPAWAAESVLQGVAAVLLQHVRTLASTSDSCRDLGAATVTKTGRDISDLVGLSSSLRSGADRSADAQLLLLDLLRSLVLLRSHIILQLLSRARAEFYRDVSQGEGEAPEGEAALRDRLLALCLRDPNPNPEHSRRQLERCLFHYLKCHSAEAEACVVEAVVQEQAAAKSYVAARRMDFRRLLASAYNIVAISEASGQWLERMVDSGDVSAGGQSAPASVPLHLSRILLVLADEKSRLRHVWGEVTVEGGFRDPQAVYGVRAAEETPSELERLESLLAPSAAKEKSLAAEPLRYCDYLLRELVRALLEEYALLTESLASGAFPGAPAGGLALSAAKAADEMEFLRLAAAPLLPLAPPPAQRHRRDASRFPLAEQLLEAGRALMGAMHK